MSCLKILYTICIILILTIACKKETFYTGKDAKLTFSMDTVMFDTVFTSIGSATQRLKVYNNYDKTIKITSIYMGEAEHSLFILNINGINTNNVTDIEIDPKDSITIFIQFFMKPSGNNQALLIKDSLIFELNQNKQKVLFEAFGQDVHLIKDQTLQTQNWIADKPYLIFGNVLVDSLATLTIDKGVKLFFHRNANLKVKGTLIAKGDYQNPITLGGDRLEELYRNIEGQWGGIQLLPGSKNNILEWLIIKNGISGIQVGDYNESSMVNLNLSNTIIQNMSYNCLLAICAQITANNCVFANADVYTCSLLDGGDYNFYQCTFADYSKSNSALCITDIDSKNQRTYSTVHSKFQNCIIYGNDDDELILNFSKFYANEPFFLNCLLKSIKYTKDSTQFTNCLWNKLPVFKNDKDPTNFELDSLSVARKNGDYNCGLKYPFDLKMNNRVLNKQPDIGAYEYVQKTTFGIN